MIDIIQAHTKVARLRADAYVAALARTPSRGVPAEIAIGDWDDLFRAVTERLSLTVGELTDDPEPKARDAAVRVRSSVLECVEALDQLHSTLAREAGRRHRLELEVFNLQSSLSRTHADLAGAQLAEKRARHLVMHDSLTLLPNRGTFLDRLEAAVAHAEPRRQALAVLYLDLDGFKGINDQYGHDVGDELLRIVATRLIRAIRAEDLVSRVGGDEFACLLLDLPSREQLSHLACKLRDATAAPLQIGNVRVAVRPSIGISVCPANGTTAKQLFKTADAAMCRAKQHRTGYAFCDESAELWARESAYSVARPVHANGSSAAA
ncbi:MAG: GGDEF domain-containing protein [Caldimonas sp.]